MLIPKPIKKWIKAFRGDVAPILILLSAMLGFWFGLMPGWYGIHAVLLVLALVLNVHFGLFLIFAGIGKSLCFAAAPLLYHTGGFVQHKLGFLLDMFVAIPILGITDVSRYAVAGALFLGPVVGLILGLLLAKSIQGFRNAWLNLEDGSEAFNRWRNKRWVRLLETVLIGKGTADVRAVLKQRPKLIRVAGVVVSVVVLGGAAVGASMVKGDALIDRAESSLTSAHGAEVNLASLDLAMLKGRIAASGIAATDPDKPTHNLVSVGELTADISLFELSRGRIVMDEVKLSNVVFDGQREKPGKIATPADGASTGADAPTTVPGTDVPLAKLAEVESYFQNAEQVRELLRTIREWLPSGEAQDTTLEPDAVPQSYLGYLTAVARQSPSPRVLIRRLVLDNVEIPVEAFGTSRVECTNLSDAPTGLGEPVVITIESKSGKSSVTLSNDYARGGGKATISGRLDDIDLAKLQESMKSGNPVTFRGGLASAKLSGSMTKETMDIGVGVSVKDLQADATGGIGGLDPGISSEAMKVLNNVDLTLRLVGPTDKPKLVIDSDALGKSMRDALVSAGKEELARRADQLLKGQMPDDIPGLDGALTKPDLGSDGGALKGLLPGKKKEDKEQAEAPKKEEVDDAKKKAQDALGGLFGGKKKDKD